MKQTSKFHYEKIVLIGIVKIRLYYHSDYSGSTSLITDSSGGIVEETFYDPYGGILEGGSSSRYQYEGKEFSSVTNDYDYKFRKYNPEVGIFTQPEQLFPNIYDPQQLNRYRFERNNPYKHVDPDGKNPVLVVIGGIAITYAAIETTIDVISLTSSIYSYVKDPNSKVNFVALAVDIVDISSGPFSNPGPSGAEVHAASYYWKKLGKKVASEAGEEAATRILYNLETRYFPSNKNTGGVSGFSTYGGILNNPFSLVNNNIWNNNYGTYAIDNTVYHASLDKQGNYYCGTNTQINTGGGISIGTITGGNTNNPFGLPSTDIPFSTKPKNPRCGVSMSCK